jgi:membrane protein required for beta-lactamase induction
MTLLAILISLALERLLPAVDEWRSLVWFRHYQGWLRGRLAAHEKWQGIPALLLIVLTPVAGVALAQYLLHDILLVFSFAFSIVVLTYCLGPKDEHRLVHRHLDAVESGDNATAQQTLEELLPDGSEPANDEDSRIRQVIDALLVQSHERVLGVLFWFMVLGPMGAVLYHLTVELMRMTAAEPADAAFHAALGRLHQVLAWIPAHLAALGYAVMGSFVHAMQAWKNPPPVTTAPAVAAHETEQGDNRPQSHRLLLRIGLASLQFDTRPPQDSSAIREALDLCGRSLIAWVTILALMTLAGWAS